MGRPRPRVVPVVGASIAPDVWYAAYGSNTDAARFSLYLRGCDPAVTDEPASRPGTIDLPLRFAEEARSSMWGGGGVAFVDPRPGDPSPTLVRLWHLPRRVLAQVGAQENGLPLSAAALDLDEIAATGSSVAFPGRWYDTWIGCGKIAGIPVVTLTSSVTRAHNPPGARYAGVVARGLRATHGLGHEEVIEYLRARDRADSSVVSAWRREVQGYGAANA